MFFVAAPVESFAIGGVPSGSYSVVVVALNAQGESAASNAVTVQVPSACTGPPQRPRNVQLARVGRVLTAMWDPPAVGGAVASYSLQVGGAVQGTFTTTARAVSRELPRGAYTVQISASNPCGSSEQSTPRTVIVP